MNYVENFSGLPRGGKLDCAFWILSRWLREDKRIAMVMFVCQWIQFKLTFICAKSRVPQQHGTWPSFVAKKATIKSRDPIAANLIRRSHAADGFRTNIYLKLKILFDWSV